ncbi:MAG: hypothetical protein IKF78_04290 [Atopobiaceae bacterium]|nr:hypothetical protein [Atopobiaceae bacterium]
MENTCPKCGLPTKSIDEVCANCGTTLKGADQADETRPDSFRTPAFSTNRRNQTADIPAHIAKHGSTSPGLTKKRGPNPIAIVAGLCLALAIGSLLFANHREGLAAKNVSSEAEASSASDSTGTTQVASVVEPAEDAGRSPASEKPVPADQEQTSTEDDKGSSRDSSEKESPNTTSSKYPGLVGTWKGKLQPSDSSAYCYGASEMPLVLDIKKVDATGMITADIHVCFHGHSELANSAASDEGDAYMDYTDVVLTYSNGQLRYSDEKMSQYPGITCMLNIILDVKDIESSRPSISGLVDATYDLWDSNGPWGNQTDYFVLERQ